MGKQDAARMRPRNSRAGATATPPAGGLQPARGGRTAASAPARERLLRPSIAAGIAAAMVICLALMFPREPLRERLLGEGLQPGRPMDAPTLDYLQAWLRVSPPDAALVAELAERHAREGRLDEAEALLARIDPAVTHEAALPMLRARLDVARQRANAAVADTPARQRYRSEQRTLLWQAAAMPAVPSDLIAFAAQARALGADDLEVAFYRALACPKPAHAAFAGRRQPAAPVRSEWRDEPQRPRQVRG